MLRKTAEKRHVQLRIIHGLLNSVFQLYRWNGYIYWISVATLQVKDA
jgi:hypothetical protein